MHLLLARHGETDWNVERRIQGWGNSKLTDLGLTQIESLGKRLIDVNLVAVYSSDAGRAVQTAKTAIGDRQIPLTIDDRLRETSWGRWEGRTASEIAAAEPELWSKFINRDHEDLSKDQADWESTTLVPEGEPILQASRRVNTAVKGIIARHIESADFVLVVGHGGSLRFVIAQLLGLGPSDAHRFHLDNASLTHFAIDPKRTVIKLINDSSHWSGAILP